MHQSHVIEVNGAFVGAAITTASGFRFMAVDVAVEDMDQSTWRTLDALRGAARHLFLTGRMSTGSVPADPMQSAARSLRLASVAGRAAWTE